MKSSSLKHCRVGDLVAEAEYGQVDVYRIVSIYADSDGVHAKAQIQDSQEALIDLFEAHDCGGYSLDLIVFDDIDELNRFLGSVYPT